MAGGENFVTSKGLGSQRLGIVRNDANLYWRAIDAYGIPDAAAKLGAHLGVERVGVFGEVFGHGVQDLAYGADAKRDRIGYAVFDVRIKGAAVDRWLDADELVDLMGELAPDVPLVPQLYAGAYDEVTLMSLAEGTETVSGTGAHLREGLVVRPAKERYSSVVGGRAIAKLVSAVYLTRKGGTEFE